MARTTNPPRRRHATERRTRRTIRSIGVASAILYAAVLWGATALVTGVLALIIAGVSTNDGGVLRGFVHTVLFVGIGVIPLIAPVLLALFIGCVSGALFALIYNAVAKVTGGIQVELGDEDLMPGAWG